MNFTETKLRSDGFKGAYYTSKTASDKAFIVMVGDSDRDFMTKGVAKWLNRLECNVMGMCAVQKKGDDTGYHSFPLEYIQNAAKWLLAHGNHKIGIIGASVTGMTALIAGSYISEISLVVAFTPCDFVMQGFYQGKKEGMKEWPAENQAVVSWKGNTLPYQPFYMSEHEYWDTFNNDRKKYKEMSSLTIFRHSESVSSIPEEAFIKAENINGKILIFGAEDDTLWDTVKYCKRMEKRLKEHNFKYPVECYTYKFGTHFIFPEGMLKTMLPIVGDLLTMFFISGRKHPKECKNTRIDVENHVVKAIKEW